MRRRNYIVPLVAVAIILIAPLVYVTIERPFQSSSPLSSSSSTSTSTSCASFLGGSRTLKSNLKTVGFEAVTKFQLPSPGRDPNAVAVSPSDESVWFGEQSIPGVGHLYPNGTLIEYAWPFNYTSFSSDQGYSCSYRTDIWGIALWSGKVWASDVSGNQLVALDPKTGSVTTVKLPTSSSFPYTMTVSPDNDSLWFTEISSSKIGRVFSNGTLVEYPLLQDGLKEVPAEITFVNSTLGYYVDVGGVAGGSKSAVYRFNPQHFSPQMVGADMTFFSPDSIAATSDGGGLWIDEHGPSSIAFYNLTTNQVVRYPTSSINYTNTVLPYFVRSDVSSSVWFNEHYGNKIARLDLSTGTLTEYEESDPPPSSASQIDNALTFALSKGGAWFTAWTANYVGFVDASYQPAFSLRVKSVNPGIPTIDLKPGGGTTLSVTVEGTSSGQLSLQFSDSESFGAVPRNVTMAASVSTIRTLNGVADITVTITAKSVLLPGDYVLLITVSDGLTLQSDYVRLHAGGG